jgi:hypothetical protein
VGESVQPTYRIDAFHEGGVRVKTTDSPQAVNVLSQGDVHVRRRSLLRGLTLLPIGSVVVSGWWIKPSPVAVLRNGWVLSKDD